MLRNTSGKIGEGYFVEWHRQIANYNGHHGSITVLKDVSENLAYTVPVDIDFVITRQDGGKVAFHEVKYFKQGLKNGNIYFEEVKDTAKTNFQTVIEKADIRQWTKPKEGESLSYLPEHLEYRYGAGWIFKNTAFHADFYHFCLPVAHRDATATPDEIEQMRKQARPGAKFITEAPTGIWISMEHSAATCLYRNAKEDQEYALSQGKDNRHVGDFVGLNFSTALVMTAQKNPALITMPLLSGLTADGKPLSMSVSDVSFTLQLRPVVKCITPDSAEEVTEIMEPAVTDYYIPKRLLQICEQPSAYKLCSDKHPSKHDCQALAGDMQAALIKKLQCATVF